MSLKLANEIFLGVVFCTFWVVQRGWQCVGKLNILNRQDSSYCSNHRGGLTRVGMEIILLPLDSQINVFLTNFNEVFGVKRHKRAAIRAQDKSAPDERAQDKRASTKERKTNGRTSKERRSKGRTSKEQC